MAKVKELTIVELGLTFSDSAFGKALLSGDQNHPAYRLLSQPLFRRGEEALDRFHLVPLGLLYTRGTTQHKVDSIFKTYDSNGDGIIYTTTIKRIIRDFIHIAVLMIPSIAIHRDAAATHEEVFADHVEDFVEDVITSLF